MTLEKGRPPEGVGSEGRNDKPRGRGVGEPHHTTLPPKPEAFYAACVQIVRDALEYDRQVGSWREAGL